MSAKRGALCDETEDRNDDSAEPVAKRPRLNPPRSSIGLRASIKGSSRAGTVVEHHPDDQDLCFKLRFDDGAKPDVDWFAADKVDVESLESVGLLARVASGGRVGKVVTHHPLSAELSYKLEFDDGKQPASDWFHSDAVEVQSTLEGLRQWRDRERERLNAELNRLQLVIDADFSEYKRRLQVLVSGQTLSTAGKLLLGLVPGGHVVSEAATHASALSDVKSIMEECASLASVMGHLSTMYTTHSSDLESAEPKLLNVLSRQVKVFGESYLAGVTGASAGEPAQRVLTSLLAIKSLSARLDALEEMGFLGEGAPAAPAAPVVPAAAAVVTEAETAEAK